MIILSFVGQGMGPTRERRNVAVVYQTSLVHHGLADGFSRTRAALRSMTKARNILHSLNREECGANQWLRDLRTLPELRFEPVTADIAHLAGTLERSLPGDPADRIIVATAMTLRAKLVTADDGLRRLRQVDTVW